MKQYVLIIGLATGLLTANAQVGGYYVHQFLELPVSARITALGGNLISVKDADAALAFTNPSLLNPAMHSQLTFNHSAYLGGIQYGYAAYAHHARRWGTTFHGGIRYLSYGQFDAADEYGTLNGTFKASEYALTLGAGRQLNEHYSVGANLKLITARYESYAASGLSLDLAGTYFDSASRFCATFVLRNMGTQFDGFSHREPLPFEVQVGISKKLRYLPFRLSVVMHHLQRWDMRYDKPADSGTTTVFLGETSTEPSDVSKFADNFFRHFIFGGEFLLGKSENFRVRIGYNHQRRSELSVSGLRSLSGFSAGVGIKINRFRIDYGYGAYHLAGSANHFSISTSIDSFRH